jgi:maltooligosyltrehalose trehalohydrolase
VTGFEVWAPSHDRVRLALGDRVFDMVGDAGGWWRLNLPEAGSGTDYAYLLSDDDTPRPDPRSRRQPAGVHGPSRVYDHDAYRWQDHAWTGRGLPGAVIYEMHIGTYTPDGTFDSAIDRLDHLVRLGVDLVEVLPVAAFNGTHNWGYDGVAWYAVQESYGGPDGLKRFVDACHQRGLGVILDAVYNHFGPSGAYAPMFAPYLAETANTWGRSLNLDGPRSDEVRRYVIDSALAWLRDFHIDGLRLDAVHALVDHRATHLLEQLAAEVDVLATHLGRPLTLIAESDLNDARLITPREAGGYGLQAQWDDDAHHALHTLLTGERQGYYGDFGSLDCLATVWAGAFFHAGTFSTFRGRTHGRPVDRHRTAGHRFVAYLQNHDQIGNRATGDRLPGTLSDELLLVGAVLLFTGPFTPMLFMGEEWAASTPWQFFTSHPEPELGRATAEGRRAEFARHGWPDEVPDPQDPATFERSKLDWDELLDPRHANLLAFHRRLIALRKAHAGLSDPRLDHVDTWHGETWIAIRRGSATVVANLGDEPARVDVDADRVLLATANPVYIDKSGVSVLLPAYSAVILDRSDNRGGVHGSEAG